MKTHNLAIVLLVSFLSLSLKGSNPPHPSNPPVAPARPSTPPITDQQLTTLGAFFRVQTAEKILESIKNQFILGKEYASQATIISKYTNQYKDLLKAIEETKIILNTASIPNANKKIAINNLKMKITELYNSIQ